MKTRQRPIPSGALAAVLLMSVLLSPALEAQTAPAPIKALIVTGQNYHPWKMTSAALKQMLEDTGLFQVDIAVSPPAKASMRGFRPKFANYRLVVLDYSGDPWPSSTQKDFVSYVKSGGGVVVYHSADNTFPKWPEYNEIIGLAGWGERTDKAGPYVYWKDGKIVRDSGPGICGFHGPEHAFLVVHRDPDHPITAGLPPSWMHASDELYGLLRGPAKSLTVLATARFAPEQSGTGRDEPVLFTVTYGAGRIFHTVLGHARPDGPQPALECAGFIVTFRRGAEWAATGKVTQKAPADFPATNRDIPTPEDVRLWPGFRPPSLEAILKDLDSLEYSRNEEVIYRLREYVLNHRRDEAARADTEERLLGFLIMSKNAGARLAACRQLRLIGSEKSVGILGQILLQNETTDMARYALEKIPGEKAAKALLDALKAATGDAKLGLVSSLGARGTQAAVEPLAALLAGQDPALASAAAIALGRIGGQEAATALSEAYDKTQGALKADIASALLVCAGEFASAGDSASADGFYGKLLNPQPPLAPLALRQSALKGKIMAAGKESAPGLILETLSGGPQEMHAPAIGLAPAFFKENEIGKILALLPRLPEASQVQVLAVLFDYPREAVRPAVLAAAKSASLDVRVAALRTLARVGDASTVPLLAERAAGVKGREQTAARNSLWTLPGPDVDEAVLFWLVASPSDPVRSELIQAAAERRLCAGKNILMAMAGSGALESSQEATRALRVVASPGDIPGLLQTLLSLSEETAQEEMASTIGALAQRISHPYARADDVEALLAPEPDSKIAPVTEGSKRCLLYVTLGKIGDDSSLPLLRAALQDPEATVRDAAVRALADWPNSTPSADVLEIARSAGDLTHQVLALRGFIRMIGLEKYQSPQEAVKSLQTALALAPRPDEKKLVLGALPDFACPEALALAESLLNVEGVRDEARAAVAKIKEKV